MNSTRFSHGSKAIVLTRLSESNSGDTSLPNKSSDLTPAHFEPYINHVRHIDNDFAGADKTRNI